jgi:hypothetical protein
VQKTVITAKIPMKFMAVIKVGFFYYIFHITTVNFAGKQTCKNPLFITAVNFVGI